MTVHDLAERVGVASHVVRYYTQRGLLVPRRNPRNGYREYAANDVYRLRFICRAKRIGFTLKDISLILRDADGGVSPCQQVRRIVEKRSRENEAQLVAARQLQDRIQEAIALWESIPDQPPDHKSLCQLIDAIAVDGARESVRTKQEGGEADEI